MPKALKKIGILGAGQLAEFIITGINKVSAPFDFMLSPRSHERGLKLKNKFTQPFKIKFRLVFSDKLY